MHPRLIVQWILNKLERRHTDAAHQLVIGRAGGLGHYGRGAQTLKWREPFTENRQDGKVAFSVDAAELARSVIDIEVARELLVSGQGVHRIGVDAKVRTECGDRRVARRRPLGQVLSNVGARAEQSLLLTGPEHEADGSFGLHTKTGENACGLEHDGAARAVIGSSIASYPTVEMRAGHDDAGPRLSARQVAKDVVGTVVGVLEVHPAVDLQADLAHFRQSREPPVILRPQLHTG